MIILDSNIIANGATGQYSATDINSIAKYEGKFLCASNEGLYQFTGTQDNNVDINSYFILPLMDFGLAHAKRLRFVYTKYEAAEDVTMTITTENSHTDSYILPATTDNQFAYRTVISRTLFGTYFQFKFAGASFSIDEVSVVPIVRGNRLPR